MHLLSQLNSRLLSNCQFSSCSVTLLEHKALTEQLDIVVQDYC